MEQAGRSDAADVHAGTLADRLEAFQDRDVFCCVGGQSCNLSRTKIFLGAVAATLALLLLIAAVDRSASTSIGGPEWTVTSSLGTHHMLIVHVDARPTADLKKIGRAVVTPVAGQYDEVLIYVRSGKTSMRRIQWTPEHGYVELVISS
jgi:hypothetical protein